MFTSSTNSPLEEAINAVLEENRQEIIASATPHLEKEIMKNILSICNKFSQHYTFDELNPDRE